ncbi:MAG TPA: hypothetical protein VMB05_11825 [Solirubrobacteraceae bacterium]|nr:hypothetical protein [Solirubrobacteraceae bacterium]
MIRLLSTWLLVPLVAAALLAGCGSSSSSSSTSGSSTATTAGSSTSTAAQAPVPGSEAGACKQRVQRLPGLPAATRERLERICDRASSSDPNAVRKAAEEGCRELINASPLPNGAAKERALAACKNAGGSKSK